MYSQSRVWKLPQVGARLGVHQRMLDALLQPVGIDLKDIGNFTNTSRSKSFLVDVDVAIVGASIRSIHIKVYCRAQQLVLIKSLEPP